jgi:hypothetical protein
MDMTTHPKKSEPDPVLRTTPVLGSFRKIRFSFAPSPSLSVFCVLNSVFCVPFSSSLRGAFSHAL